MTPELLDQYLKVLKAADMQVFRIKMGEDLLEGNFAPPPMPEFKGSELEPGGWKSPTHLDNVTSEVID